MSQKRNEFIVNRKNIRLKGVLKGWVGIEVLGLLILILLLVSCVDLTKVKAEAGVKKIEVGRQTNAKKKTVSVDEVFLNLKKKLIIPVLKPTYLPDGYFVSSDFDVRENSGKNPRVINSGQAEIELEQAGYDKDSEYGHKWLRFSFGSSLDIANYSTPGLYINGNPALYVGGKKANWAMISWVRVWKGHKIRYALEGSGISGKELIRIAKSMKQQ
ncbi:MAG TPA: hypothetical protein ENH19_03550 [Actinobacteria bacterium]|nr:hypothetical protein [Actinomycetes bacterium]HEX21709.1 hypothetical protein [Actinomycetota bacterium]